MRILHFSDPHLREPWYHISPKEWLGKRFFGGINLLLGRGRVFADAHRKVAALEPFCREPGVDLVICTGDYTALGTRRELRLAREAVAPLMKARLGYANVPGNHDLYALDVVRERRFVQHFGDTLNTDLPDFLVDGGPWPQVRLLGDETAVVAVNSARPNFLPWRASTGRIPQSQLKALSRILGDLRVQRRFVFVITHYAPRLANGQPDRRTHGMVNADDFLQTCADLQRGAILCGHVHWRYMVRVEGVKPPVFCAGSATKAGVEGLWMFDVEHGRVRATPGAWATDRYVLDATAAVQI